MEKLIKKIKEKKDFSDLTKRDIDFALEKFIGQGLTDEEIVKGARKLLMENYTGFGSRKLFTESKKVRSPGWILKKHLSTRERVKYYSKLYKKFLEGMPLEFTLIDLGCGVDGFSYPYLKKIKPRGMLKYVGIDSIGQLVRLTNNYFMREKIPGKIFHISLFDLDKVEKIVRSTTRPRLIMLLKVIDSLESLEKGYSEKLILKMAPLTKKFVVSFPTKSMVKRSRIWAKRTWFLRFVKDYFNLLEDFELGDERYLIFENK